MPKVAYITKKFSAGSLAIIAMADQICNEYAAQGFTLTLRQLYYQFVSRGYIANKQTEYDRLGSIVNDARLAGMLDWFHLEDRTRNLRSLGHWETPSDIIHSAAASYRTDKWRRQQHRIEVWIEKDALVGVIQGVCDELDVPYFSCRGYTSQSEVWRAGMRFGNYVRGGMQPVVIHLGDHDPSGVDMSRDIEERLSLFAGRAIDVQRIALNMDQVQQYNPPPNPAKLTDARAQGYIAQYGYESWELDALEPTVIAQLIRDTVAQYRDEDAWSAALTDEQHERAQLAVIARQWDSIAEFVDSNLDKEDE